MRVLVATESTADDRKTLAAVRSLGRSGAHVTVSGDRLLSQPSWSRFCEGRIACPSPTESVDRFVRFMLRHVASHGYDVLLPLSDHTTIPISLHKPAFEPQVAVPVPDYVALSRAHDKAAALELARQVGIATPETHCPQSLQDVRAISETVRYPCVVKPRKGAGAIGIQFPRSPDELLRCYAGPTLKSDLVFDHRFPIIQEYVPGEVHDVCLLFNTGEPRAALTQKRLLMCPSSGGVGIYNETTDEPELRDKAIALLKALEWHGPAQVEFKRDSRDGCPKLIEVNSRFWGTLDLSIQAGVDFPLLACKMALDGDIDPVFEHEVGLSYRWPFPYGVLYALRSEAPWRALWEFVRYRPNTRSDLWLTDPLPHLAELALTARRLWPQ
jgi:predicted ATP-grasp superfamily ATP-dependent carboligase